MKINKVIRNLMTLIVLLTQVTILILIANSNYESDSFIAILSILIITIIVLVAHKYLDLHHNDHSHEKLSVVIWAPIGALLCFFINVYTDLGFVIAAGIVGTLASLIPLINNQSIYLQKIPVAIYCGVFVGMSSQQITPSFSFVLMAGILAGAFLSFSKNIFIGIGGKLGTMAFLGVLIVYLINLI
ncbi:hypothetical protein KO500_08205 [Cellulophaga baltica]|uniref:hypothetical protein n=1 Tax=Cellulophaga TaxID=104264 RepID=UPI001C069424|nr:MULTISPECIES: hypothetical protein [Cellulophaga]MBU2996414.1 hypothetical protein [Cellulophaga baltica]MDO6767810.1 hypothetical protein [Cellulophaga sp. 1_MG-2023]